MSQAEAAAREIAQRFGQEGWLEQVKWQTTPAKLVLVVNCTDRVPNINAFGPYRGIPVEIEAPEGPKVC